MKPIVILYTGNGKGKTTAALGGVFRAMGRGGRCAVIQFIKSDPHRLGEYMMAKRCGFLWETYGKGFLWSQSDLEPTRAEVRKGLDRAKELAGSGCYDLLVLDELTYALSFGLLDEREVLGWISDLKAQADGPCLIITGRGASEALISAADTVTEMVEIKHHYRTLGEKARELIEY